MKLSNLIRVESIVPDADRAHALAAELFGSAEPAAHFTRTDDGGQKSRAAMFGATIVRFVEPDATGPLADFLAQRGPGVRSLLFATTDLGSARIELEAAGIGYETKAQIESDLVGIGGELLTARTTPWIGDDVTQFCEPTGQFPGFSWCDQLEATGPGMHNLTFLVRSMGDMMTALAAAKIDVPLQGQIPWDLVIDAADVRPDLDVFCIAATADTFGFHLELTEKWTEKKLGILHKPVWGMS
ncbi:MAG: hypothetical protein VCC00_06665 [Deltaproteobacteria bacterium]